MARCAQSDTNLPAVFAIPSEAENHGESITHFEAKTIKKNTQRSTRTRARPTGRRTRSCTSTARRRRRRRWRPRAFWLGICDFFEVLLSGVAVGTRVLAELTRGRISGCPGPRIRAICADPAAREANDNFCAHIFVFLRDNNFHIAKMNSSIFLSVEHQSGTGGALAIYVRADRSAGAPKSAFSFRERRSRYRAREEAHEKLC